MCCEVNGRGKSRDSESEQLFQNAYPWIIIKSICLEDGRDFQIVCSHVKGKDQ